jgi:YVTN family beta-propeller protein
MGKKIPFKKLLGFFVSSVTILLVFLFAFSQAASTGDLAEGKAVSGTETTRQRFTHEGIAVEFSIDPVHEEDGGSEALLEGKGATVHFKIGDTATGSPVTGLHPSAWMDMQRGGGDQAKDLKGCKKKIQSFMQGLLSARPTIDLNAYYILTLNRDPDISVIDPIYGFGGSKLLALIMLKSPGEDWALSSDKKRLFVSMPMANQVAVIDTATWKVEANIDAGSRPNRLAIQPDEKYLWVGIDVSSDEKDEGGVIVIDPIELNVAAIIKTGKGRHEIAFTDDSRYAFVTNKEDGTLTIVDVEGLKKIKVVKTGRQPSALAFSGLSKAVYVANEGDGNIVVVDGQDHKILSRIKASPGLVAIRFAPGGRFGFTVNSKEDLVQIFDSSTSRILQTLKIGKRPDQVSFTQNFAYIRSRGTADVSMIQLAALGKNMEVSVLDFPGGQIPPEKSTKIGIADAIAPAPDGNSVLVSNPLDKTIYYYEEGMAAPMGNFQNYGREPMAVLVLDRNLRETAPGIYSANVNLTNSGRFDVAFLLDSPRIIHCFETSVNPNPAVKKKAERVSVKIEPLIKERRIRVGVETALQFKLTDPETAQPKIGIKDVRALLLLSPGVWQKREWLEPLNDGVYEVVFKAPKAGAYFLFFESPSLGVRFNQLPYIILQATDDKGDSSSDVQLRPKADVAGEEIR